MIVTYQEFGGGWTHTVDGFLLKTIKNIWFDSKGEKKHAILLCSVICCS
jgi:hypothetical protein